MSRYYPVMVTEYRQGYIRVKAETPEDAVRIAHHVHTSGATPLEEAKDMRTTAMSYVAVRERSNPIQIVEFIVDANGYSLMTEKEANGSGKRRLIC